MNPVMRPAGILIPSGEGPRRFQTGFNQIEAGVEAPGTAAESTCVAKPLQNITLVVKGVDDYIASGQLRAGEQPVSLAQSAQLGTLLVTLEPLLEDGLEGMTPGSSCIVNAYTSFHEELKTLSWVLSSALACTPSTPLHWSTT